MGDYLSNLVARSFDLGEVVQPRPVSLFEPTLIPGMQTYEEPDSLETGEEPFLESPRDTTPIEAHSPAGHHSLLPRTNDSEENTTQERRDPPDPTSNNSESRLSTRELPTTQSVPISTPKFNPVTNQPDDGPDTQPSKILLVTSNPSSDPIIRKVPSERESYPVLEPMFPPPIKPANEEPHTETVVNTPEFVTVPPKIELEERSGPEPVDSGSETSLNQPSTMLIAVQPQITALEESPKQRQFVPVKPLEAAPTIHVTIGRLEVRATSPPSPPQKEKRSRAPVMSLDEYLSQRANGSGR